MYERNEFLYAIIGFLGGASLCVVLEVGQALTWPLLLKFAICTLLLAVYVIVFFFIYITGGSRSKGHLNILCWAGYDEYFRKIKNLVRRKLKFNLTSKGYYAQELYDLLPTEKPDIIIFGIEAANDLYNINSESRLVPLEDAQISSPFLDEKQHVIGNLIPMVGGKRLGLPIRFGTISLAFNKQWVPQHLVGNLYNLLFGKSDFTRRLYKEKRVGVANWYLPTMGVISKVLGNPLPFELEQENFEILCEHLLKLRRAIRDESIYWGAKGLKRLREDLNDGDIWLVPGGGEWVIDASLDRKRSKYTNISWRIPQEGAIVWVECVGVTQNGLKKLLNTELTFNHLIDFLSRYLLSEDALVKLNREHLYPGIPINYQVLSLQDFQKRLQFINFPTPKDVSECFKDGTFIIRNYPPQIPGKSLMLRKAWSNFWEKEFSGGPKQVV